MNNCITKDQSLKDIENNIKSELAGKKLWGDLDVSFEEHEILRNHIKELLKQTYATIPYVCKNFPISLTTYMVFLVRYKYNFNFWGLMSEELAIPIFGFIESEIGGCARSTFTKFDFDFSEVQNERRVNLEPIFYEAGLPPESSLDDLFYVLKYDSHSIFDPQLIIDDLVEMRSYQIRKPMQKFLRRFKDDRAVEFILDVHDAILSVDQCMASDSNYIGNYTEWKERERSKEVVNTRKKQEFQTKPYLSFENGKKGLCLILPRTVMKSEWIEDVEWCITGEDGYVLHKKLSVLGVEGQRFVESISIPVSPSEYYTITLIDNESIDDSNILEWTIDGIKNHGVALFNSNGRMINVTYLPYPYGIMILGEKASILKSTDVNISHQSYPTNREQYSVISLEPTGRNAIVSLFLNGLINTLHTRPQIKMFFEGNTLFSLPSDKEYQLFVDIPTLHIDVEESSIVKGLELRIGKERIALEKYFENNHAEIPLKTKTKNAINQFGTYSVRIYQYDHFFKQNEFRYVPKIKSTYSPVIAWPDKVSKNRKIVYKFEKSPNWELEFDNCVVNSDESNYTVECPSKAGTINILLKLSSDNNTFACAFKLPIRPFEIDLLDYHEIVQEQAAGSVIRLGIGDINEKEHWVSFECFGEYQNMSYSLKLRTANGVEQSEKISLAQKHSTNFNLAAFYDTLNNCPLPAQLEIWCDEDAEKTIPVLIITDNIQLKKRPVYQNGKLYLSIEDNIKDITIQKIGIEGNESYLEYSLSKLSSNGQYRGFKCPELDEGVYVVEGNQEQAGFEFEDESGVVPSNGKDTFYVSGREKGAPISSFSDWLDQLIKDILAAGINKDIVDSLSYSNIDKICKLKDLSVKSNDYEKLITIAYFVNAKCIEAKREAMANSMKKISELILSGDSRLELIRFLADMNCPQKVFDICLRNYDLYLFNVGSADAKVLAEKIETKSIELAMLLRMGCDDSIRNTIWRDKYIDLLGREAIKTLLSVPGVNDAAIITEEQKKFLREQNHCNIRINLTKDICGDMKSLQDMIEVNNKTVYFNKSKKPDVGIYFDHIRYVDQYVNWYSISHTCSGDLIGWIEQKMLFLIQTYCRNIISGISAAKKISELKDVTCRFERALRGRFDDNPEMSLTTNNYSRFFYVQAMAAFLSKLPSAYIKEELNVKSAKKFISGAITIAPRIARRDLIMSSTFIYLVRKEEKLCR